MKWKFIAIFVLFLLALNASAFLFDEPNNEFNLDDYLVTSDDQISDVDPDAHLIDKTSKKNLLDNTIDPNADLGVDQMESIIVLAIAFVAIMFLVAVIITLKKLSGLALIFMLGALLLTGAAVVFGLVNNTNFITQMLYGNDDTTWGNITINDFKVDKLDDLPLVYNHDKTLEELDKMIAIPTEVKDDIVGIKYYNWQNTRDKRELLAIEFIDNDAVRKFVNIIFKPNRKLEIQKENAYQGTIANAEDEYKNPYLVDENRFVFLVFGPELYSDNAIDKIVDYYPQQYQYVKDDNAPDIQFIKPKKLFTNTDIIEFVVSDTESGINPLDVTLLNIKTIFDPLMDCIKNKEKNYDEYHCTLPGALKTESTYFIILATDREKNNARETIQYVYDNHKPTIKIFEESTSFSFEVTDNTNLTTSSIVLQSGNRIIATQNYCTQTSKSIVCSLDMSKYLEQGKNTFTISVTDNAGNTAQESVTTIIDTIDPIVKLTSTESNYTNDDDAEFMVFDGESGIKEITTTINGKQESFCTKLTDKKYICKYLLQKEENKFEFDVEDVKGNSVHKTFSLLSDFTAPKVILTTYEVGFNGSATFTISDAESGINPDEIVLNGNTFYVNDICEKKMNTYTCSYALYLTDMIDIIVHDNAGNIQHFEQRIEP